MNREDQEEPHVFIGRGLNQECQLSSKFVEIEIVKENREKSDIQKHYLEKRVKPNAYVSMVQ